MPKCPLARLLSLCGFARIAKVPRWSQLSVAACVCIFVNVGAAQAAANPPDGEWSVGISCEQSSYARAFSFREQVRIIGGEFSLTHQGADFRHELSGSIKDDRVRITGTGRNNTVSSDRLWRFSGRAESSREVRIQGYMNGRDTGQPFYQDCQVSMSHVAATVATSTVGSPANGALPVGETVAKEESSPAHPSAESLDPQQRMPKATPTRSVSGSEPDASAAGGAFPDRQTTAVTGSAAVQRSSSAPAMARTAPEPRGRADEARTIVHQMLRGDCSRLDELNNGAASGLASFQRSLGFVYARGVCVERDERRALELTKTAADSGDARAINNLGSYYANGTAVRKNEFTAVALYKRAAELGDDYAQANLARFYLQGLGGLPKNVQLGVSLMRSTAEKGSAYAQNELGILYAKGLGVAKDERTAIDWFRKAADQGEAKAQFNLGQAYYYGSGGVPKDRRIAAEWFRKSAEQADPDGQRALGIAYMAGEGIPKDERSGIALLVKSAQAGSAPSQYIAGTLFQHGRGVDADDRQAAEWFGKASDQGNANAQAALAVLLYHGRGVDRDVDRAAELTLRAAEAGNAEAQGFLGFLYSNGYGVPKDDRLATDWFRKAAAQGNSAAQYNLALSLEQGTGVRADPVEAKIWYERAARLGDDSARRRLEQLAASAPVPAKAPASRADSNKAQTQPQAASTRSPAQQPATTLFKPGDFWTGKQ